MMDAMADAAELPMVVELKQRPVQLKDLIAQTQAQNDEMRTMLDAAREADFLRQQLAERGLSIPPRRPTMKTIATAVAAKYGSSVEELMSDARQRAVVWPRQEAMWLMREEKAVNGKPRYSLPQIGHFFGRDHTTALHAIRAHEKRLAEAAREAELYGDDGI